MHRLSDVSVVPWAKGICAVLQSGEQLRNLSFTGLAPRFSL